MAKLLGPYYTTQTKKSYSLVAAFNSLRGTTLRSFLGFFAFAAFILTLREVHTRAVRSPKNVCSYVSL